MPTYSNSLGVTLQANGENDLTWGDVANTVFEQFDEAIAQFASVAITADTTLTITDGANSTALNQGRKALIILTGAPVADFVLTMPEVQKGWIIYNNSTRNATVRTATGTTTVFVEADRICGIYADGAGNVYQTTPKINEAGEVTTVSGLRYPATDGVAGQFIRTDGAGNLIFATASGTGNVTGAASSLDGGLVAFSGTSGTALKAASVSYQEFLTSGTWTKPAGATWVYVEAIGGGGSGRSALSGDGSNGGGGGGGEFNSEVLVASTLAATVAVTVGSGGASVTGANGNSGGASSFGSHVAARGGAGGTVSQGGNGGAGELGGINPGTFATGSYSSGGGGYASGSGGNCTRGGAGGGGASGGISQSGGNGGAGGSGGAGQVPGGGGGFRSYSGASQPSGAGGAGRVRVWAW